MALWDYLVVTASNEEQAAAYEGQLSVRRELGLLSGAREVMVVADPGGKRVGSGGSTVFSLMEILKREGARGQGPGENAECRMKNEETRNPKPETLNPLQGLRILIVHAGGDSKRMPTYGPCGKIFIPVPGESDSAVVTTLFDRQLPAYLALPGLSRSRGQVVITSGDVLLGFDPAGVRFAEEGVTGLGSYAAPDQASRHGVFCAGPGGLVRRFLQKPSPAVQQARGAVDRYGRSILDIGIMSFDAATAVALLDLCGAAPDVDGPLRWSGDMGEAIESHGLDFYREIACALGSDMTLAEYVTGVRESGSRLSDACLGRIHAALSEVPFHVQVLSHCSFLHFGAMRQVVTSGMDLLRQDRGATHLHECLSINNEISDDGGIVGAQSWVEACRLKSELRLGGGNVVAGLDVDESLSLPKDACLDVLKGANRSGGPVWFVRCYMAGDDFKGNAKDGASLWGIPVGEVPRLADVADEDVWQSPISAEQRSVWNARVFPAERKPGGYRRWLWLLDAQQATPEQWCDWRDADRYSLAEIATLADHEAFHDRRARIRARDIFRSLPKMFRRESGFSAAELAYALDKTDCDPVCLVELIREAYRHSLDNTGEGDFGVLGASRIIHTLASALERLTATRKEEIREAFRYAQEVLEPSDLLWLKGLGLELDDFTDARGWSVRGKAAAFNNLRTAITSMGAALPERPANKLRKDEIVWGRAPARLDLGGGWSDTPPYSLEWGGCVINAAVDLNGQPPIQAYARVISNPVIRLASIDFGERVKITELDQLLDYRHATSEFSLPKAALAVSGLSPEAAPWPDGITLKGMLEAFGGGIELTTLAAIPGGSGLGTSSIMGAVVLAVVRRVMGRALTQRELFHGVLRLEQSLTTGGGWQDQIGGVVGGIKVITTQPGLVPDPLIHFVPEDVLCPEGNGGCTLLYYTGITRLAKNILQNVVGRYLDRDRSAMATLRQIHAFPARVADALARKDSQAFGHALADAWELKKQIDPGSTNEQIDALLSRVQPYIHGAKLMGAGGGGFVLMVCKSRQDADAVRKMLDANPPNDRARFFDFGISRQGLAVTVC